MTTTLYWPIKLCAVFAGSIIYLTDDTAVRSIEHNKSGRRTSVRVSFLYSKCRSTGNKKVGIRFQNKDKKKPLFPRKFFFFCKMSKLKPQSHYCMLQKTNLKFRLLVRKFVRGATSWFL